MISTALAVYFAALCWVVVDRGMAEANPGDGFWYRQVGVALVLVMFVPAAVHVGVTKRLLPWIRSRNKPPASPPGTYFYSVKAVKETANK